jgi:hypothetical protein
MMVFWRNVLSPCIAASALKMEVACFSKTLASSYKFIWCQNSEEKRRWNKNDLWSFDGKLFRSQLEDWEVGERAIQMGHLWHSWYVEPSVFEFVWFSFERKSALSLASYLSSLVCGILIKCDMTVRPSSLLCLKNGENSGKNKSPI